MIPLALWSALTLRLGTLDHGKDAGPLLYLIAVLSSIPIFAKFGLYRAVLRFIVARAFFVVVAGVGASVALTAVVDKWLLGGGLPATAFVIYLLVATFYVCGSRALARSVMDLGASPRSRVIIYGAGEAGAGLALALRKTRNFVPVAFVDGDVAYQGTVVLGLEVFAPACLETLVAKYRVRRVLLALPCAPRAQRREIILQLERLGLHVQTMPDVSDIVTGRARVDEVRDIAAADLLGRDCVAPNSDLVAACIRRKVVMITGAGGSIGSELCRQIVRLNPTRIVLFEMSEHALYRIDHELRMAVARCDEPIEIVALLGNAQYEQRVRDVMSAFGVQTVFHAAAYKHLPIVEENVVEGIWNNVMATLHSARAAGASGVEKFVLISTDKAVRPTSVMGATKRIAELVLHGLHACGSHTRFCVVRFGNVLDSSGSVVPLFREQISRGGPITVTHPEVTRYFMTIPEAAQLVLQAGSMARGGEVFVLDMGQPVRIDDLARRMIRLMGLKVKDATHPEGDIAIEYTGLRVGEKLHEELLIDGSVTRTDHPMIRRALEGSLPWEQLQGLLRDLHDSARNFDCRRALRLLAEAVTEYDVNPSSLSDLVAARAEAPYERGSAGLAAGTSTRTRSARRSGPK